MPRVARPTVVNRPAITSPRMHRHGETRRTNSNGATYCAPIRSTPVDKVDTEAVLSVLKPLWMRAPETASRPCEPPKADLEAKFGAMPKPNDEVDVALLHALDINAVDFLVTQDLGIHTRARRASLALGNPVLTVSDAVAWLRATFEMVAVESSAIPEVM